MKGRVTAAVLGSLAVALGAGSSVRPTDASWNDHEWVASGPVQTVDCTDPETTLAGTAAGRVLGGSLLGLDLDTVAELDGVRATTDGEDAWATPAAASPVAGVPDAWRDPLDLMVLSALGLSARGLTLPLDTPVGVVGQFAQAHPQGDFFGAAGAVTDSGLLELEPDGGTYPTLASLDLKNLVDSVVPSLGTLLSQVTDLSLQVGAVGSRAAVLDACDQVFAGAWTPQREYLVADLDLELASPLVSDLVTDVEGLLTALETAVAGIAGDQSLVSGLVSGVSDLLGSLLGVASLGTAELELSASVNLEAVRTLLVEPVSDSGGVLVVRPGDGTISVDLAALLAEAYPGEYSDGLNGLDPNTSLLGDERVLATLVLALTDALDQWTSSVQLAVDQALDLVEVHLVGEVAIMAPVLLAVTKVASLELEVSGTLGELLANEAQVDSHVELLGLISLPTGPITNRLLEGLGSVVGGVVQGALLPSLSPVVTLVGGTVAALTTLVSQVYTALFLDGVVEVTLNAQNDPALGDPEPEEWAGIPQGRYDVAALRVGVLDALGALGVYVHLARSSVGPLCWADGGC